MKFVFSNFLAFGKRISIDLRVVVAPSSKQYHFGFEEEISNSPICNCRRFVDIAETQFMNLVAQLSADGYREVVRTLISLKDECEAEAYAEEGCSSLNSSFSMWIGFLSSLNETTIIIAG